mgnify:CR=1 FL=1
MDYNAAKLLIAIAQAGSLSAASEQTGVPISTLSRKMNELEQDLQVQLLHRSKQGVKLTPKGQDFFEQSLRGMEWLEQARQAVQSEHQLQGKLRMAIPPHFPLWWDLLMDFQRAYPDIQVFCQASERLVDFLEDGIDVALRMGPLHTDQVVAKPMMSITPILAASPTLLARYGVPDTISALLKLPTAAWATTSYQQAEWYLGSHKVKFNAHFAINDPLALCRYAVSGMGATLLPDYLAQPYLATGELVQLLPDLAVSPVALHLIYPHHKHPSAIVRTYVAFCESWLVQKGLVSRQVG